MSQSDKALLALRQLILNGELAAGERFSELSIVDRLGGFSRTPVKLALVRLAEEGLVEEASGGGYIVSSFDEADIRDAIELRGTVEGLAARKAAERRLDRQALAGLRDTVGALDAVVRRREIGEHDFLDYIRLNQGFHDSILTLADSRVLRRAFERIVVLPFASPSAFVIDQSNIPEAREVFVIAQAHHRTLLEALSAGEGARAEAIAREHARLALKNLQYALASSDRISEVPGSALIRLREAG
ncbi:MAG: GntR family transcriptional regulator [Rhodospirillales bacterium]|nr:GntR family transcriptional regulator [Rhodospirillales bacterium]